MRNFPEMNHFGIITYIALYLLLIPLLFDSCKPDDGPTCGEMIRSYYTESNFPGVEVKSDNWLYFDFVQEDTTFFPYTGRDTLRYEIRDSLGNIYTVDFIGEGKQYSSVDRSVGNMSYGECIQRVQVSKQQILYKPSTFGYSELTFELFADYISPTFRYKYEGTWHQGSHFSLKTPSLPAFMFNGKEFYNVQEYTVQSAGKPQKYYVNKDDQLILIIREDSSYFFRVNN